MTIRVWYWYIPYAYVDILATYSDSKYRTIALLLTVSISPIAPFCLHASPID